MAVSVTGSRFSTLFNDSNGDGKVSPDDTLITHILLANASAASITAVTIGDSLTTHTTYVPGTTVVTMGDIYALTGNTPITFSAGQGLLANDYHGDGLNSGTNVGLTVSAVNGGALGATIVVHDSANLALTAGSLSIAADGSFTFTPATGYTGTASFGYDTSDGAGTVGHGTVNLVVSGLVWYVDGAGGNDATGDGSYLKPFATLSPLSTGGSADSKDGAGDTIVVHGAVTGGIVLETNQILDGDGSTLSVNGHQITNGGTDSVINHSGAAITLASGNTIDGVDLHGTALAATGITDNGASVGTLTINHMKIDGDGQAVDIDTSGVLNVTLSSVQSGGFSTASQGGVIDLQNVTGTFGVTGLTVINTADGGQASGGININAAGLTATFGNLASVTTGGTAGITLAGATSAWNGGVFLNTGAGAGLTATSGTATIASSATISTTTGAGVVLSATANASFGATSVTTAGGTGVQMSGTATAHFASLADNTGTGAGIAATGGTLDIGGGSVTTTTGQIVSLANTAIGTGGITFTSLTATGVVASGNAINLSNVDNSGGNFSGGTVNIAGTAGATADGIHIDGGSTANFTFGSTIIGGASALTGDGIEVNGAGNGTVSFTSVAINNVAGDGVKIVNATNSVTISGGSIGSTNDPTGIDLNISGGTGAVSVAASLTKSTAGHVIDISSHATGQIDITGAVSATGLVNNGISISSVTSGVINVTGSLVLTTGANNAIDMSGDSGGSYNFTNGTVNITTTSGTGINMNSSLGAGPAVTFNGGNLNLVSTTGSAINAVDSNPAAATTPIGSLTISGANNNVSQTGAGGGASTAININGVAEAITLKSVNIGATTASGNTSISLQNAGASGAGNFFQIQGTGGAGTGGTIAHAAGGADLATTQGIGIYLNNVGNISLNSMNFNGTYNNFGILGKSVNNFTLNNSDFHTGVFGTQDIVSNREGVVTFGQAGADGSGNGLTGTANFQGDNFAGAYGDTVAIFNNYQVGGVSNSLVLNFGNVTANTLGAQQAAAGINADDAMLVEVRGNGTALGQGFNLTANIGSATAANNFNSAIGDLLQVNSVGNSTSSINVTNNQFHNTANGLSGGGGVTLSQGGTGSVVNYNVASNSFTGGLGFELNVAPLAVSGTSSGVILNNTFGNPNGTYNASAVNASYGVGGIGGIWIHSEKGAGSGTQTVATRIEGNQIGDYAGNSGIVIWSNNTAGASGTQVVEATIKNNIVKDPKPANGFTSLEIDAAASGIAGDNGKVGLALSGNTFDNQAATNGDNPIDITSGPGGAIYVPGYSGGKSGINLTNFWQTVSANVPVVNTLINGGFPNDPSPSHVDVTAMLAPSTIANQAFTLAVPIDLAPQTGTDWESQLEVKPISDPQVSTGGETGSTAGGTDGSGTTGGSTGGSGSTDTGTPPPPPPVVVAALDQATLDQMVAAAIHRWEVAGATPDEIAAMKAVSVTVSSIAGIGIGDSTPGHIQIDSDAAGFGWFIDATPGEDSEFDGTGTRLTAAAGSAAAGHVDLLTVLEHELGHQIGLDDNYNPAASADLMFGYVNLGERRLASSGDVAAASGSAVGHESFALSPVNIGTVLPTQTVDVSYRSIVDHVFTPGAAPTFFGTGSISYTDIGGVHVLSPTETITYTGDSLKDGAGTTTTASPNLLVASLTLGNLVYKDVNKNGVFDGGDTGIGNVTVNLYNDTNSNGVWDAGDTLVTSTTTSNVAGTLGQYSFTGLAPGDYVAVIPSANFAAGQPLNALVPHQGALDPDNNVDNNNDGAAIAGGAVGTQAITLAYDTEPTAGAGNDTNNTLDFGFQTNSPPVATADSLTATDEDTPVTYAASDFTGNDSDPDGDTFAITGVTSPSSHGTVVLNGDGTVTYTPVANYNGSDTFAYTITDSNGATATANATLTVNAVNDAVTATAPATATVNEDSSGTAITGMSISDVDAALAPAGVYEVVLQATHGTVTLTTLTGLTFTAGDGTNDVVMTFHGTLASINTALATAKYTPAADYNGPAQIDFDVTDQFGAAVATGSGAATADFKSIDITVNSVNDAPSGADESLHVADNATHAFTVAEFTNGYTDLESNSLNAVKIDSLPLKGELTDNGVPVTIGQFVSVADIAAGLFVYWPDPTTAGNAYNFKFQVQDNGGTANGGVDTDPTQHTFTLNIDVSNQAPTAVGETLADAYEDQPTTYSEATLLAGDSDPDAGDTIHVSGASNAVNGTVSYDAVTHAVTFTSAANYSGPASFDYTIMDSHGATSTATETLEVLPTNDAPTITNLDGDTNTQYEDQGSDMNIDVAANAIVADIDSTDFDGGSLVVSIDNYNGQDSIGIYQDGVLEIDASNHVLVNGVDIGVASGGYLDIPHAGTFTVDFNANATPATVQELVRHIFAGDQRSEPVGGLRTVHITLTDGDGSANGGSDHSTYTTTFNIVSVNDEPLGADKTVAINEDNAYALQTSDFGFQADASGGELDNLQAVKITTLPTGGTLYLDLDGAGTGSLGTPITTGQFVSAADIAAGHLVYVPAQDASGTGAASFTFQVQDDGGTANGGVDTDQSPNTITFDITAVNDDPVIVATGTTPIYVENAAGVHVVTSATVTDVDNTNFNGGSLVTSATGAQGGDQLTVSTDPDFAIDGNGVISYQGQAFGTVTGSGVTYTVTFDANATPAIVGHLLEAITFTAAGENPDPTTRDITFVVTDGAGGSTQFDSHVGVVPVNDAPTSADSSATFNEDTTYVFQTSDFPFSDPAEGNSLAAVQITTTPANGTLYVDTDGAGGNPPVAVAAGDYVAASVIAAGGLTFVPAADANGTGYASFGFKVEDNGGTANGGSDLSGEHTFTLNVTNVNDAPAYSGATAGSGLEEGTISFSSAGLNTIVITDVDGSAPYTATLSVGHGTIAVTASGAAVVTNSGTDTVSVSGTLADVNATLDGLVYAAEENFNGTDTLHISTTDSDGTANGGSDTATIDIPLTVAPINDAPTVVNGTTATATTIAEDTPSATGDTVSSLFGGHYSDAADQVSGGSSADAFAGVAVTGNDASGTTGQWQYYDGASWVDIGTVSDGSALLLDPAAALRFNPAQDYEGAAPALTVHLIDASGGSVSTGDTVDLSAAGATGGTTPYSTGTVDLGDTVTAVNDDPVLAATGTSFNYTENDAPHAFTATLAVSDVDNANFNGGQLVIADASPDTGDAIVLGSNPDITYNSGTGAVSYQGDVFAQATQNAQGYTLDLNANATPAAIQALIADLSYVNNSDNPIGGDHAVTFTLTDGAGGTASFTDHINVIPVNDAPSIANLDGDIITYVENDVVAYPDTGATAPNTLQVPGPGDALVTDPDSADFAGATLTVSVSGNKVATEDRIIFIFDNVQTAGQISVIGGSNVFYGNTQIGTINAGGVGVDRVVTFNANATATMVSAVIHQFGYTNTSDNPSTLDRTIAFTLTDGDGGSTTAHSSVHVTAVNDNPLLDLDSTQPGTGTNNGLFEQDPTGAGGIAPNATVSDVDSANFDTGTLTVSLTANGQSGDQISIIDGYTDLALTHTVTTSGNQVLFDNVVVGTFTAGDSSTPLVVTFNANATPVAAAWVTQAVNVVFTADDPSSAVRTLHYALTDGDGGSASADATYNVTSANDAPQLGAPTDASVSFTENGPAVAILQGVVLSDPDNPTNFSTGSIDIAVTGTTGEIDLKPGSNFTIHDNGNSTYTLMGPGNVAIGDISGFGTTHLQITNLTANATPAVLNDLVDDFTFSIAGDNVLDANATITLTFNDGHHTGYFGDGALTATQTQALTVSGINDAPVVDLGGTIGTGEDANQAWLSGMSVTDPDADPANDKIYVTFQVAHGVLDIRTDVAGGIDGSEVIAQSADTITVQATQNQINATLAAVNGLTYSPTPDFNGDDTLTVTANDAGYNGSDPGLSGDGTSEETVATRTIVVSATNDAPVVVNGTTEMAPAIDEDTPSATGNSVGFLFGGHYWDQADNQIANGGSSPGAFGGIAITANGSGATGQWQYWDGASWVDVGAVSDSSALTLSAGTAIRFNPAPDYNGPAATLTAHLADDNVSIGDGAHIDLSGVGATGGTTAWSTGTVDLGETINPVNDAPVVDLNGAGAGTSNAVSYTEGDPILLIAPATSLTDVDSPNFANGVLTLSFTANGTTDDQLIVIDHGALHTGDINVDSGNIYYQFGFVTGSGTAADPYDYSNSDIRLIGIATGGNDGSDLVITLTADATPDIAQKLLADIGYENLSSTPSALTRTITVTLAESDGVTSTPATVTINFTAVDSPSVPEDDFPTTTENHSVVINVLANDSDPDGPPPSVAKINGQAVSAGQTVVLASGALAMLNADGTITYDPYHKFDTLTSPAGGETGASNTQGVDSFTYTTEDGSTATVTVNIDGVAGPGDWLRGSDSDDVITGTSGSDLFMLHDGGDDSAFGLDGNDVFYFGGALTSADQVDGGNGRDVVILQGNYAAGVTLGAHALDNVEALSLQSGSVTRWGDTAGNQYSYNITTVDANVAAAAQLIVNASSLLAGEDFTFNGAAETDGAFLVYGGAGTDHLTGGAGNDIFDFEGARWNATDTIDGGAGRDVVIISGSINGMNNVTVGVGQLTNVEALSVSSRYAANPAVTPSYNLTLLDGNVTPGGNLIVNATSLTSQVQTFALDAHTVTGNLQIFGGSSSDTIVSGSGNDLIYGGLGQDTMTGGAGADIFQYRAVAESTVAAPDHILDFVSGVDKIDLHLLDANPATAADDAFVVSNDGTFHGINGEIREFFDAAHGWWVVDADVNGDGQADFTIHVTTAGNAPLASSDFIL